MNRHLFTLVISLLLTALPSAAQQGSLSGRVIDSETREAMIKTTLQLYRIGSKDTTFVKGAFTDSNGRFSISGAGITASGTPYVLDADY